MSATFGAPLDEMEQDKNGAAGASGPSDEAQELLDPNDPALVSEDLAGNPDADAYAAPAPPPDQKWRVKLKLMPKEVNGQRHDYIPQIWGEAKQKVFVTGIEATILDPTGKHDGLKAYDFNVSTFVGRDAATKVMTILARLRKPDGGPWVPKGTRMAPKGWMDVLVRALAGEPECGIESQWEWSCSECGKIAKKNHEAYPRSLRGMYNFPEERDPEKRKNGQKFSAEVRCQKDPSHGVSRARINIGRFMSLEELKGAPQGK